MEKKQKNKQIVRNYEGKQSRNEVQNESYTKSEAPFFCYDLKAEQWRGVRTAYADLGSRGQVLLEDLKTDLCG